MTNVPKYAQDMMSRAQFDTQHWNERSVPGCTIIIRKETSINQAWTFRAKLDRQAAWTQSFRSELDRLVAWARRMGSEAEVLEYPASTLHCAHRCIQTALVTICGPVMEELKRYIPETAKEAD